MQDCDVFVLESSVYILARHTAIEYELCHWHSCLPDSPAKATEDALADASIMQFFILTIPYPESLTAYMLKQLNLDQRIICMAWLHWSFV